MRRVESFLLYVISFAAFGNVYYVAPLIGVSHNTFLLICLVISFVFSFKWLWKYRNEYYSKFFLLFLIISSLLIPINIGNGYIIRPNDMIRVFWFVCVFNWIRSFYKDKQDLTLFLKRMSYLLFIFFIILSVFEYNNPLVFQNIVYGELDEDLTLNRLAITFRDANVYAAVICFFLYIIVRTEENLFLQILFLATSALLINFTGSRMGGLLFVVIALFWLVKRTKKKSIIILATLAGAFYLYFGNISSIAIKDNGQEESLVSRLVGLNKDSAEKSTKGREDSLKDGITFGLSDNLWFPAGNFYFDYKWRHTTNHGYHFPHSGFIYLFCEYGIYSLFIFFFFLKLFFLAKKKKEIITFLITVAPLLFLPNSIYIFPLYFGSFLIEYKPLK